MARSPLRILCFGDSLTSGYHDFGLGEHPYSDALARRLEAALPARSVLAVPDGEPGDFVSHRPFQRRLANECLSRSYDWVVVLGGTNDLASSISVDSIFDALHACWDTALARGFKVLALTVPECRVRAERLDANRRELNRRILAHKQPNFYVLDLFSMIPFHSLSRQDRDTYWDDGLHLTAAGYDWMGGHIADGLLRILSQQEQAQRQGQPGVATPTAPKPSAESDGHKTFDDAPDVDI